MSQTELNTIKVVYYASEDDANVFKRTFDIWVKNIWGSKYQDVGFETEDPKQYAHRIWNPLIPTTLQGDMTIMWSSGLLAGDYEFIVTEITYTTEVAGAMWKLTLKKSDAEIQASGKFLPNKVINAIAHDYFFFINISLPQSYVVYAEEQVQSYLETEIAKIDVELPTYTGKPSSIFCATFPEVDKIRAGSRIFLRDARLVGPTAVGVHIVSLTKEYREESLLPEWDIVISDKVATSQNSVSKLQGDVRILSNNTYSNEQTIAAVVKSFDRYFLRKDGLSQRSESPTAFNSKLEFSKEILSNDFIKGELTGAGFGLFRDSNGNSVIEVDRLNIRKTLFANELVINQVTFYGGRYLYSAAGMEVIRVEDNGATYRCYMDTKQGTILNQFAVGDQALCERFAPTDNQIIKYYWRLVEAVGTDYIDLSYADCDAGSGVPSEGDNIAQVGHRTEESRQAVLIIDQLSGGSVIQYAGINGYSFAKKNYVGYGVNPSTGDAYLYCYGDMYFGDRDLSVAGATGIAFEKRAGDTERNLYLQGKLTVGSSGLHNFTEWDDLDERITLSSPYNIDLTNENASVGCDYDGVVIGSLPTSKAIVYSGGTEDTGWLFSAVASGCSGTVGQANGEIVITSLTDDSATFTVTAIKANKPTLVAVMNISKVRGGENVTIYSVSPSVSVIKVSKSGVITPSTIFCSKIMQVGNSAPVATTDKILKYHVSAGSETTYVGALTPLSSWVYIDFILYDDDGTTIIDKERVPVMEDGSDGLSGSSLVLTTNHQVFLYDASGSLLESLYGWYIYTTLYNSPGGAIYYEFKKDNISLQNTISSVLPFSPASAYSDMPNMYEAIVRVGSASGTEIARDMITVYGVKPGAPGSDGYTIVMKNESHSFPSTFYGTITSYDNSGTDISVWHGVNKVPYGSGYGQFLVTATSESITVGSPAQTVSTYIRRFPNHTSMVAATATITYTISVKDQQGAQLVFTKQQVFTIAKSGSDADNDQARNDIAARLGYGSYANMVALVGSTKTIIKDGNINTSLLQAFSILTNNLSTSAAGGERVTINQATNSLHVYDGDGVERVTVNGKVLSPTGTTGSTIYLTEKSGSISKENPGDAQGTYTYGGNNILASIAPTASNNTVVIPAIIIDFSTSGLDTIAGDIAFSIAQVYLGSTMIGSAEYSSASGLPGATVTIPASSQTLPANVTTNLTVSFFYEMHVEIGGTGFSMTLDTTFSAATGSINYSDSKTEIAKNGLRWMWATNKYFEVSADTSTNVVKMEAINGSYGFRIHPTSGFQKTTDGGENWVPAF